MHNSILKPAKCEQGACFWLTSIRPIESGLYRRRLRADWGECPPNLRWGDCPCIRPPIFGDVVLRDAREKHEVLNNCDMKELFFVLK